MLDDSTKRKEYFGVAAMRPPAENTRTVDFAAFITASDGYDD
jgi:hypothetical protein